MGDVSSGERTAGGARGQLMKGRWGRPGRWQVPVGRLLQWLGPVAVLIGLRGWWAALPGWAALGLGTLLAGAVAQTGLGLARLWRRSLGQMARDTGLLGILALAGWAGTRLAVAAGGGAVDPALLALAAVYLVNLWPAV
ncbi:MAG: hypothetical protein OWV35_05260 [Firmicutes bacterium]|nr:hypothetical protein [Bacillota bacterium]